MAKNKLSRLFEELYNHHAMYPFETYLDIYARLYFTNDTFNDLMEHSEKLANFDQRLTLQQRFMIAAMKMKLSPNSLIFNLMNAMLYALEHYRLPVYYYDLAPLVGFATACFAGNYDDKAELAILFRKSIEQAQIRLASHLNYAASLASEVFELTGEVVHTTDVSAHVTTIVDAYEAIGIVVGNPDYFTERIILAYMYVMAPGRAYVLSDKEKTTVILPLGMSDLLNFLNFNQIIEKGYNWIRIPNEDHDQVVQAVNDLFKIDDSYYKHMVRELRSLG